MKTTMIVTLKQLEIVTAIIVGVTVFMMHVVSFGDRAVIFLVYITV